MGYKMKPISLLASALGLAASLSAGAQELSPNQQLLAAARQGNLAAVARLLDSGAAVDSRNRIGDTTLMIALKSGNTGIPVIDAGMRQLWTTG